MSRYAIERASFVHKDEILGVLQRNLSGITDTEKRYTWAYINPPHRKTLTWIARDNKSDGKIVGTCSLFLRKFYVNGKPYTAAAAGDFAVDKAHRIFGPALIMQKTMHANLNEDGVDFTYSIPNSQSESLMHKIGYKVLSPYCRYIKLLKSEYKDNETIFPSSLSGIATGITDLAIKRLSKENWYKKTKDIETEITTHFDSNSKFDELFNERCSSFGVIGDKSSAFRNWRYLQASHYNYHAFSVMKDGVVLLGYLVYYIHENMVHIVDMLFSKDKGAFRILLSEFSLRMREENVGSISVHFVGTADVVDELKKMNFIAYKKSSANVIVYAPKGSDIFDFLVDSGNWYFMEGDKDI